MQKRKIWLGLGTAVLAAAPLGTKATGVPESSHTLSADAPSARSRIAQHQDHSGAAVKAPLAGQAGEGGEGGHSGSKLPVPLRFYRNIELVRGHHLIGTELVQAGRWEEALPHFLHPQEEIYGDLKDELKNLNVPPFLTALKALAQTVKAKNKDAFKKARASIDERLAAAEKAVLTRQANAGHFSAETAFEVLQSAVQEFEGALKDGRIVNPVEYQDSRGFVFEADRLFGTVADQLAAKNAEAVQTIQASLAEIKAAFPAPSPPDRPVKDAGQLLASISEIELQLDRLR